MQHYSNTPPRGTPPHDIVQPPSAASSAMLPSVPSQSYPGFLVIGLFALRLTKRLIEGLDHYTERDVDIAWLTSFLAPYPLEFALAKVSGSMRDDYVDMYREIVSRMKRQPRYPIRFMQMNPDQSMRQLQGHRRAAITDLERLDIVDFCDAAGEWGSVVPIPAGEAKRMIELADQRRIVDLDTRVMVRKNE